MKCPLGRSAKALSLCLVLTGQAQAQTGAASPGLEFSFACPGLTTPKATEVEARSRVEAQLAGLGRAEVRFICGANGLDVRLQSLSEEEGPYEVHAELKDEPLEVALVDLFVRALETLPIPSTSRSSDEPGGQQPAQTPAPKTAEPAESPASPDEPTNALSSPSGVPSRSPRRGRRAPAQPFARLNWDGFLSYGSLGSEAIGTVGGGMAGLLGLGERFRAGPVVRVGLGIGMPESLSLTAWNVGLLGEFSPLEWLSLGLGPEVSIQMMSSAEPTAASGPHALWGGCASAHVLFGSRRAALRAGVMLNVLASDRVVRVEGVELMHIPPVNWEVNVGGRFGFFLE